MTLASRAVAAVVLVLALAGCGSPSPTPTPRAVETGSVQPTSSATPEPAALVVERPKALVNFDCNRMLTAFAKELASVKLEDAQALKTAEFMSITDVDVVLNAGGQVCQATNGQLPNNVDASGMNYTQNSKYEGIVLWILPNATEARTAITADHKSKGGCAPVGDGRYYCQWNQLIGSTWVYVDYFSRSANKVSDRMNAFMVEVGSTPVSATTVGRPVGLAPVPADCESVLGGAAVTVLAGHALTAEGWKIAAGGIDIADAAQWNTLQFCAWYDDNFSVSVRTVEGGAWLVDAATKIVAGEQVKLDSPATGERAVMLFNPLYADSVYVLVTSGGNLYEVGIYGFGTDYRAGAKTTAEALLDRLES
jgi:hypothetical protein